MNQILKSFVLASLLFSAQQGFSHGLASSGGTPEETLYWMRVKAKTSQERTSIAETGVSIEVVNKEDVVVLGNAKALEKLKGKNRISVFYKINALDFPTGDANFHNYAELKAELDKLAATYPGLVNVGSIGKSLEGRDIFIVSLGEHQDDPSVAATFFVGGHHAREHISVEMPLMLAQNLAAKYAAGDAQVKQLLATRTVYIVPSLNVDGSEYDISTGRYKSWRKNRRNNGDGTMGVDLNRNYGYKWGTAGASGDTSSETYYGKSAFSEPETQAVRDFVTSHPNISLVHSYHTFSELILYPWGWTDSPVSNAKDFNIMSTMANKMATFNNYTPQQSSQLYQTSGDTCDWAYGALKLICFTTELDPREMWDGGFYPGQDTIDVVFTKNWPAALYMIEYSNSPARVLEPAHAKYGLSSPLVD